MPYLPPDPLHTAPLGTLPRRSNGPLIAAWMLFAITFAALIYLAITHPAR